MHLYILEFRCNCKHVIKLFMELKADISELKDSFGNVLDTITPKMCRQVMLSMQHRLQPCVQSGGQCFENLFKVANLHPRQGGTPTRKSGAISVKTAPFLKKKQVGVPPA